MRVSNSGGRSIKEFDMITVHDAIRTAQIAGDGIIMKGLMGWMEGGNRLNRALCHVRNPTSVKRG